MLARLDHNRLLRYAGLFTWVVIGLPLLLLTLPQPAVEQEMQAVEEAVLAGIWRAWLAWAVFGFCYAWLTRALGERRVTVLDYTLLVWLAGSAIASSYYSQSGLGSTLRMAVACGRPGLVRRWQGVAGRGLWW